MLSATQHIERNVEIADQLVTSMIRVAVKEFNEATMAGYGSGLEQGLRLVVQRPELAEPMLDSLVRLKNLIIGESKPEDEQLSLLIREMIKSAEDHADGKHNHE